MKKLFLFLFLFAFCSDVRADITSGLLSWWKFDEGTGTTAIDSSGNGETGTLTSGPAYVTGNIGPYALSFNGTSTYVNSSNFADNLSNFTAAVWVKISAAQVNAGCGGGATVSKISATTNAGWEIAIPGAGGCGTAPAGSFLGCVQMASSVAYLCPSTSATYVDSKWHHFVMVVTNGNNAAAAVQLYVDGKVPAIIAQGTGTMGTFTNPSNVEIGNDSQGDIFKGSIDDVRIYNRALSATDVRQLYSYSWENYVRIKGAKLNNAKIGF